MNEFKSFLLSGNQKARDDTHRLKILKAVTTYDNQVDQMKNSQFKNWLEVRRLASAIKEEVLKHWPDLLEEFESKITHRGAKVWWARDKDEAQKFFLEIANRHTAKKIVKSKSMTTEEIEFNEFCESNGLEILESDLGELIVQLAGEKPYHIVTPAMHKSRIEIGRLFQEKLNTPFTDDPEQLTMVARKHLRNAYITSDIGVTGANFIIADEGAIVMTENEGNGRLTMSCPPVHVAIVGIEKIIPRLTDLSLFLPLLATSGTGQQITGYNSIIRGPRQPLENDGPSEMHIILLDNGRSKIFERSKFQSVLKCIRCGACLNVCPVYRSIGGHSYHTTYQGPIGSIITPQLIDLQKWGHLTFASSLCAACSSVCPVDINLHHLLLESRWEMNQKKFNGFLWKFFIRAWTWIMLRRSRLTFFAGVTRPFYHIFLPLLPAGKRKRVPAIPKNSFAQLWEKYEQSR
jgi:L-lactate dehydrogenase complex protein LldF